MTVKGAKGRARGLHYYHRRGGEYPTEAGPPIPSSNPADPSTPPPPPPPPAHSFLPSITRH